MTTEIQKYFGASTPDGLGFQFRGINKGANILKQAVANDEDPVEAFAAQLKGGAGAAGSVPATPSHQRTPGSTTGTGKRARSGAVSTSKRRKAIKIEPEPDVGFEEDDVDSPEVDYSDLDVTPTKLKPRLLSTPRKNPQLVPHSAWVKPADKIPPRPPPIPIAPAPPRTPAPAAYTITPIAGLGSAAVPNGYTDPATGFGYNCAPPVTMGSAGPSAADSSAISGMINTRRGSAFSNGSFTAGSSPATPTMPFSAPAPGTGVNLATMNVPGMGMKATTVGRAPTNMPNSFNMAMFESAASPNSVSEAHTPQTTASSNTVVGSTANFMETSSKASREDFSPFDPLPRVGNRKTSKNGPSARNANAKDNDYMDFSFETHDDELATALDFPDYEDDEGFQDAGEV